MRTLLHIDDDESAAVVFRTALDEAHIQVTVYRVPDGEQALRFLRGLGPYARPDLVFLDLNLPKVDGWQVLTEMRADKRLQSIPVVMLSTSSRPADKERAYALGAQHYIVKPGNFYGLVAEVESAYMKWVGTPSAAASGTP